MFKISRLNLELDNTLQQLYTVLQQAYQVEAQLLGAKNFPPLQRSVADIRQSDGKFYGLWLQDTLAAALELEIIEQQCWIQSLVVMPSCFRRGYGRSLLQEILRRYNRIESRVQTGANNTAAIKLYQGLGFYIVQHWQTGDGIDMVTLRKAANPDQERTLVRPRPSRRRR